MSGLTNHPITGPMFTGPHQTPFVCTTTQFGLQPLVDSTSAPGYKVTNGPNASSGSTIGYSTNCSINTFVTYLYRASNNSWKTMPSDGSRPADMSTVTLADGRTIDFIVRREIGSINRFLYSIAMLSPAPAAMTRPVPPPISDPSAAPVAPPADSLPSSSPRYCRPPLPANSEGACLPSWEPFPGLSLRSRWASRVSSPT